MIEQQSGVHRRYRHRAEKAERAQHARYVGPKKADIVVVVRLKAFLKQVRRGQHDRTAVHDECASSLEQPRGRDIRPLGRAEGGEGRKSVVAQAFRDIIRVEHAVEFEDAEPCPHLIDERGGTQSVDIAQADRGVRAAADAQEIEFEPCIAYAAADERKVWHEAFGKALARTGQHALVLRLLGRTPGEALCVDDQRTRVAFGQHERVAVQKGGERLVHVGLDAAVIRLQNASGKLVRRGAAPVGQQDGPHQTFVDGERVHHAVKEEHRAVQAVPARRLAHDERVVAFEYRLHERDVVRKIFCKCDFLHKVTPRVDKICIQRGNDSRCATAHIE